MTVQPISTGSPDLDDMMLQVVGRKTAAGKPLTPTQAGRAVGPSGASTTVAAPSATANGTSAPLTPGTVAQVRAAVAETVAAMRAEATRLEFAVDLILNGVEDGPVRDPVAARDAVKVAEKEADQRAFERQQKELAERAQGAAFSGHSIADEQHDMAVMYAQAALDGKWTCPVHGEVTVKTSTRTNREYRACPRADCNEIERR